MQFRHLMKPLSNLARPGPDSPPSLETQIAALESASPDSIAAAALGEGQEALRAAAIRKLADGNPLRSLAGLSETRPAALSAGLKRAAQERLAQLIDAGAADFA